MNYGDTGSQLQRGERIPKGYEKGRIATMIPKQRRLLKQRIGELGPDSYLSRLAGGDEDIFNQIEAPAYKAYSALQGSTASRFSGLGGQGSLGARRSSGFYNEMNQQSSDFAEKLAANRHNLRTQAISGLHEMSNQLLGQRPYETVQQCSNARSENLTAGCLEHF